MISRRPPGLNGARASTPGSPARYLIERDFPDGLSIPQDEGGAKLCGKVIVDQGERDLAAAAFISRARRALT
jgi:hypothetical protein